VSTDKAGGLVTLCRWLGLPEPVREYEFAQTRKWRFDLAWPGSMVAAEVDGGVWTGGRHTRGKGYEEDCEKLSVAAAMGWRVICCTPGQVEDGRAGAWVKAALEYERMERVG
jgi:hypothetical protein